jgi:hypothetical protein
MTTPLATWDNDNSSTELLVWWTRLDQRWQVEVHRTDNYNGILCIFDHSDCDALRHSEPVGLSYGAICGPDVEDVASWQDKAILVVDALPGTLASEAGGHGSPLTAGPKT